MEKVGNVVDLERKLTKANENTVLMTKAGTKCLTFQVKYEK